MNGVDTIVNVNPALQPAGAVNPDVAIGAIRNRAIAQGTVMARQQSGRMLRRIFGPTSLPVSTSIVLLVIRSLFGGWCVYQCVTDILSSGISVFPILMALTGIMIGAGAFTRMMASAGASVAAYAFCHALSEGLSVLEPGLFAAAFSFIALVGPGRFSFDSILRHNIFRTLSRRQMRRLLENRFSYRAMEFAEYN